MLMLLRCKKDPKKKKKKKSQKRRQALLVRARFGSSTQRVKGFRPKEPNIMNLLKMGLKTRF